MLQGIENCFEAPELDDVMRIDYIPTPSEIQDGCKAIQAEWSSSERIRRYVGLHPEGEVFQQWSVPLVSTELLLGGRFVETDTQSGNH